MQTKLAAAQNQKPIILVVVGPTAIGKTACGIALAGAFSGEIISADSRQFYKELIIGTAKPSDAELAAAPHHFINTLRIGESYTAGQFERDGLRTIDAILARDKLPIVVGGSGMYIDALIKGLDHTPHDPKLRRELNELFADEGLGALQERLRNVAPEVLAKIDFLNPRRVMRAIEIAESEGMELGSTEPAKRPFRPVFIGLEMLRTALYTAINARVDAMIERGLEAEAASLKEWQNEQALQTVGYREWWPYFEKQNTLDETIAAIKQNTRRYAKRQMTWFRGREEINWFKPEQADAIRQFVEMEGSKSPSSQQPR